MTTLPLPTPSTFLKPLRQLARSRTASRTGVRRRRPRRHRTLAQPPPLPVELWDIDHTELRNALEQSWH